MVMGRPSTFNDEIANKILTRIAGGESVSKICKDDEMPHRATVWEWSAKYTDFGDKYLRAMKSLGSCEADRLDEVETMLMNGEIDHATARVLMDSIKWKASKFYPKMYGDRQTVESKNENVNINTDLPLTEADLAILQRHGFKVE